MGLLDLFDDPSAQIGLGLLAAASPRADAAGFGQRLMEGVQGAQGMRDAQMKRKMQDEQYNMLKLQEQRAQQQFEMQRDALKEWQGTGQPAPSANTSPLPLSNQLGSGTFGIGSTNPVQPPSMPQSGGGEDQLRRLGSLAIAGVPGAKELLDIYKYKNTPVNAPANSWSINPVTGAKTYNADATKALTIGPNGIERMPGSENIAGLAGDAADAQEAAKSKYDIVKVNVKNADGTFTPTEMTRAKAAIYLGGVSTPQGIESNPPEISSNRGLDLSRVSPQQLSQLSKLDPNALAKGVNRFTSGSGVQYGVGQSNAESDQSKLVADAGGKINDTWLKTTYEPVISNGQNAQSIIDNTGIARTAMRSMGGTGWGTEAKAAGASFLAGIGVASKSVEAYASNAQLFQKASSERLWSVLNSAKGPQTEGDASRAKQTYGQLANTPQANEFIFDLAQANAERDKAKATFFDNALPIARQSGDLSEVSREWAKRMPSIFDMPSMKRWKK
jgi:hypothetical protein